MGLDIYVYDKNKGIGDENSAYWRKCYGIAKWLKEHGKEVPNEPNTYELNLSKSDLEYLLDEMSKKLHKITARLNESYHFDIDTLEDLRLVVIDLYTPSDDTSWAIYEDVERIIKSFNCIDLNFDAFADSIWSPIQTFIMTYRELCKQVGNDTLYAHLSY